MFDYIELRDDSLDKSFPKSITSSPASTHRSLSVSTSSNESQETVDPIRKSESSISLPPISELVSPLMNNNKAASSPLTHDQERYSHSTAQPINPVSKTFYPIQRSLSFQGNYTIRQRSIVEPVSNTQIHQVNHPTQVHHQIPNPNYILGPHKYVYQPNYVVQSFIPKQYTHCQPHPSTLGNTPQQIYIDQELVTAAPCHHPHHQLEFQHQLQQHQHQQVISHLQAPQIVPQQPAKKDIKRRTRTGCLTCRKRRIKCDERKPSCNNCNKSKVQCLGYQNKPTKNELKRLQRLKQHLSGQQNEKLNTKRVCVNEK